MATFDELVLEISLVEVAESLHAKFYLYELNFPPSGVSVATPSGGHPGAEHLFGTIILMIFPRYHRLHRECFGNDWLHQSCSTSSPGGNLVDGLPPVAHMVATRRGTSAQVARDWRRKNNYV